MARPSAANKSSYGKVPTSEEKDTSTATDEAQQPSNQQQQQQQQQQQSIGCWELYLRGGRLTPEQKAALASRKQLQDAGAPAAVEFRLHPESIRQLAYAAFWSMCLLAILLTKALIPPDVIEDSDLKAVFGYNNICVYWDYTPSRELVALYYPLFEYSFLLYVILDHIQFRLSFNPTARPGVYRLAMITLPIKIVLIAWFRMIFVYQVSMEQPDYPDEYGPYIEGALGHTMGFFGLQLSLILVSLENVLFINLTGVEYPLLGARGTTIASWLYFFAVAPLTLFKIYVAFTALTGNKIDNFQVIGKTVDHMWMVLVAFMPIVFAQVGRKTEAFLKITVEQDSSAWKDKFP